MPETSHVIKENCTAIVVDDDADTVDLFVEFLQIYGIKIVGTAFDGKEAVNLYKNTQPDIVFSDVMMPEYDGVYALEKIKQINPRAIMIMVTGDLRQETFEQLEKLHADSVVHKPFDMYQVMETVNSILAKSAILQAN